MIWIVGEKDVRIWVPHDKMEKNPFEIMQNRRETIYQNLFDVIW